MQSQNENSTAFVGLSDLIIWVRRNLLLFIVPVVACIALGVVYILIATPKYKVDVLLSPVESNQPSQGLGAIAGQLGSAGLLNLLPGSGADQTDIALAVLESRRFLVDFITRHEIMTVLYEHRWDAEAGDWRDDGDPPPTLNDAYRLFGYDLMKVDTDELTGFVTVSLQWHDAEEAVHWLEVLIRDLNSEIRSRERDEATRSLEFLRAELARTDLTELRQALFQLSLNELQRLTLANVREEFAFEILDPPNLPDPGDYVSPNKAFALLASASIGVILGILLALLVTAWRVATVRQQAE